MCRWRKCRQLRPALARAIYRFILWLAGGIGAVITMSGVDSPFVSAEAAALGARCRFCGAGCGVSVNEAMSTQSAPCRFGRLFCGLLTERLPRYVNVASRGVPS